MALEAKVTALEGQLKQLTTSLQKSQAAYNNHTHEYSVVSFNYANWQTLMNNHEDRGYLYPYRLQQSLNGPSTPNLTSGPKQ